MRLEVNGNGVLHELDLGVADPAGEPLGVHLDVGMSIAVGTGAKAVAGHDVAHQALPTVGGFAANVTLEEALVPLGQQVGGDLTFQQIRSLGIDVRQLI